MKLYNFFIPNKKNKFHPKALQPTGLLIFLAIFLAITPLYNLVYTGKAQVLGYATNIFVENIANLSNQERANNGLAALNTNSALNSAAYNKALDMFADNYWAHNAPDGTTPWDFIISAGYNYNSAGENLAKDFNTSEGVIAGWMTSDGHRANILGATYTDVGYAVVNGVLLGSETTLVVAMYGSRTSVAVATVEPTTVIETSQNSVAPEPGPIIAYQEIEYQAEAQTPIYNEISTENSEATNEAGNQQTENETIAATENSESINQLSTLASIIEPEQGSVAGWITSLPIQIYNSLNLGQKASLLLLAIISLLFAMKHTLVWREHRRGFRHIWLRAHPIGQAMILITAFIATLANGVGVVL